MSQREYTMMAPAAFDFCPSCGESLCVLVCAKCLAQIPEDARYCPGCGRSLLGDEILRDLVSLRAKKELHQWIELSAKKDGLEKGAWLEQCLERALTETTGLPTSPIGKYVPVLERQYTISRSLLELARGRVRTHKAKKQSQIPGFIRWAVEQTKEGSE